MRFVRRRGWLRLFLASAEGGERQGGQESPTAEAARHLLDAERRLRELATEMQLRGSLERARRYERWMYDAMGALEDAYGAIASATGAFEGEVPQPLAAAEEAVDAAMRALRRVIDDYRFPPEVNPPYSAETEKALDELEESVRKLTGGGCRYRASNRVTSALNDIASCIHRAAEHLLKLNVRNVGRCDVMEGADPAAARACAMWSAVLEHASRLGIYEREDYESTWGYAVGGSVYLRVGSAEGHRTHLDLERGKLRYYDYDDYVNRAMKRLLEGEAGLRCRLLDDGVECTGLTPENAERAAAVLAFATSMDFRIGNPFERWGMDVVDFEVEQVKRVLPELLEEARRAVEERLGALQRA